MILERRLGIYNTCMIIWPIGYRTTVAENSPCVFIKYINTILRVHTYDDKVEEFFTILPLFVFFLYIHWLKKERQILL